MTITEIGAELVRIAESFTKVLAEITSIAEGITKLTAEFKALNENAEPTQPQAKPIQQKAELPEFIKVRTFLAEKSRAGHTEKIHAMLEKRGFKKLSEVPPTDYAALMDEVRALE